MFFPLIIFQGQPTLVGPAATLGFPVKLPRGHWIAFDVVGHFRSVQDHNGAPTIQGYFHGVPFWRRSRWPGQRPSEGIKGSREMIFILVGCLRMIVDLHLIAVIT